MARLSDPQLKTAWEEWLASEMRANYFADLCGVYNRRQRIASWATLFLSSGAAIAFVGQWLPNAALAGLALLAAAVSLYALVAQNPKSAAECADLHTRWNKLAKEYEDVWHNWFADDAAERLGRIEERAVDASKAGVSHLYDERRLEKWEDLVVRHRAPAAA